MSKAAWKRAAFLRLGVRVGAGGHHRPHGLIRRALAAPWRKPAAPLTRRPSPAKMGAVFGRSARLCLRHRPMTAP
jgi:hypothetical protein